MKLKEYLQKHSIRYRSFAKDLGIAEQSLRSIMAGLRKPGLDLALKIEEVTQGEITPEQLVIDFQQKKLEKNATQIKSRVEVIDPRFTSRQQKIYNLICRRNVMKTAEIANRLTLSHDTTLRELHRLIELGVVEKAGVGKATVYRKSNLD